MTPYYEDDSVTLYHGDSEQIMSDWLSEFAHLDVGQIVVTSPPYNMGLTPGGNGRGMYRPGGNNKGGRFRDGYGDAHDDAMAQDDYDAWQRRTLELLWDLIPDDGAIYYNHRVRVEHGVARLPLGLDFGGIPLRQIITWDRGTGIGVNRRHYCAVAEWVLLFAKSDFTLRDHGASGLGDIWRISQGHPRLRTGPDASRPHPATFPVGLPLRVIDTTNARSVLDPFAGSGTTLVAAKQAGIKGYGIELSERYCEIAAKRLSQGVLDFDEASA